MRIRIQYPSNDNELVDLPALPRCGDEWLSEYGSFTVRNVVWEKYTFPLVQLRRPEATGGLVELYEARDWK